MAALHPDAPSPNSHQKPSDEDQPDFFALLPMDVAAHVFISAGGPAALQATRSTSKAWKAAVDSLVVSASSSIAPCRHSSPCPSAVLAQMPQLHAVDLSSSCEPLPPGRLADILSDLSQLPNLKTLHLSTWCLAEVKQQQQEEVSLGFSAPLCRRHFPAAASARRYNIIVPDELGLLSGLQELYISHCAEVSPPTEGYVSLTPAVMRLPHLTHLELHGFLPGVHHLRGLKHLQHLHISIQPSPGGPAQQSATLVEMTDRVISGHIIAPIAAVMAAVQSSSSLKSLCLQLPAGSVVSMGSDQVGKLIALLCEGNSTNSTTTHTGGFCMPSSSTAASSSCTTAAPAAGSGPACQLQRLQITCSSDLYHIPARFAAACAALQDLDLSGSNLSVDAAGVLGGLSHLTHLSLAGCGLGEVPASWVQLTELQVLNLSGNPLGVLPPLFSRLQGLQTLLLSSTHLSVLPAFISSLTRLQHLELASNKLQEVPVEVCSCVALRHLDVSKNRLLALPEHFSRLSHITQLNLTGNHLEALPSGLHNLRQLSHLGLALNYYKIWRHAVPCFASLASSLQELELQHTATVLDDAAGFLAAVGQLTALTSLCAGSNQLSVLPEAWQQLKRLKVLQLSHNAMEVLPIALLSLTALTYLDLSYNRLMTLPFWVGSSKLQQLRRLNLAKNHLTVLPDEMSGLSRLTQLQLQGNNLASVPPCLGHLQQLRLLNIGGNYKLKESGLGQQLAAIASLREVVLPYRLADAAEELRRAGKAVQLD